MRHVNVFARPQMGPNMYITPPGASTWFHQDGHGTVDSGHQCLTGRNEVVMLRRLDEAHKKLAVSMLRRNQPVSLVRTLVSLRAPPRKTLLWARHPSLLRHSRTHAMQTPSPQRHGAYPRRLPTSPTSHPTL